MGVRREGREAAMQYFYLRDLGGAARPESLEDFFSIRSLSPSARRFCRGLVEGAAANLAEIDAAIGANAKNYELTRISAVDRNILRIAVHEMQRCEDVPPVVAINEAIEIAKKYGTEESGRFVNGVLDHIRTTLNRPARTAAKPSETVS